MDVSIGEIMKWFGTLFFIMMVVATGMVFMQVQDINPVKQTINYTIERNGGLTPAAMDQLKTVSKDQYNNRFQVTPLVKDSTGNIQVGEDKYRELTVGSKVPYGESVHYKGTFKVMIPMLNTESMEFKFFGSASSQVR